MNFEGTGARLKQGDVGIAAREVNIETAALLAILEVEAAGRGFDRKNRPKMLFEPHIFYRLLGKGAKRNQAVKLGLAYRQWGRRPYPKSYDARFRQLSAAMKVHTAFALQSASWALPQIMGFNHKDAGFSSAYLMVKAMMQGEKEQVLAMVTLLKTWGLAAAIQSKDLNEAKNWRGFARRYNGSSYAKHNYHGRLAKAYRKHSKGAAMSLPSYKNNRILQEGVKGEAVRNLQADLIALGFKPGPVDGRFGDKTHRAVIAFQIDNKITSDGMVGRDTYQKIKLALKVLLDKKEKPDEVIASPVADGWLAILILLIADVFKTIGRKKQ
ncbi:MAG: N-acetylmuramidase domain-containing protein [Devosiaceae bacterium]|nr:N-acetylmuramidase domain-containing protein [Devosiaceae bacterium]